MTNCSFFSCSPLTIRQMDNAQVGFDGGNLLVAGLFSPRSQMLPKLQNRLTVADVGSVRVNDLRTSIKAFTSPQPRAVPNPKRFFH
jgi:hypothetical protein